MYYDNLQPQHCGAVTVSVAVARAMARAMSVAVSITAAVAIATDSVGAIGGIASSAAAVG